jgi:uncharacterized protein (TIGR04255 family)
LVGAPTGNHHANFLWQRHFAQEIDPTTPGTLLTVDSFVDELARYQNFLGDLPEILETAHAKEKDVFFELLKDEFLDTLSPEFGETASTAVGADSAR